MDFQGYDEIQIDQESNMILLKIRDQEEGQEVADKRRNNTRNKLQRTISSHSSSDGNNQFNSDEELCGIQIAQKLFRDELEDQRPIEVQNDDYNESYSQTSESPCSNQDLILIRQKILRGQRNSVKENLQVQTQHQEQSPFSIIPSKLNGEQKHMSQIVLELNDKPQKETNEEVGQHTTEELIREITEANPVLNPIIRREISSHFLRRRNRFHTTIEISQPSFMSQRNSQAHTPSKSSKNCSNQISLPLKRNQQRNSKSHHSPSHLNNSSSRSTISQDPFNLLTDNNLQQDNKQEMFRNNKVQQFFSPQHRQSNKSDINKTKQEEGQNQAWVSEKSPRKAIFIRRPQHFMTTIVTRNPEKDSLIRNIKETKKDAATFTQIPPSFENTALSSKKQEEGETDHLANDHKIQQQSLTKDYQEACERENKESPQISEDDQDGLKHEQRHNYNIMEQVKEESNVFSYFSNSNNRIRPFLVQSPLEGNSDKSLNSLDNIEEENDPSNKQSNQENNQIKKESSQNQNENKNMTIFQQTINKDQGPNQENAIARNQDKQMEVLQSSTPRKQQHEEEEGLNLEKPTCQSKQGVEPNQNGSENPIKKENPPEGCPDSQQKNIITQGNGVKDKKNLEVDPYKLFKEVPMHIIESRFYLKQVSQLKVDEPRNQQKSKISLFDLN